MKNDVIARIRARISPETRQYIRKNLDIVERVNTLLLQRGWTQKDLAKKLNKSESEVSRWLSGLHNVTLKSIVKLEVVLGADILVTANQAVLNTTEIRYITMQAKFNGKNLFQQRGTMPAKSSKEVFTPDQLDEPYASVA